MKIIYDDQDKTVVKELLSQFDLDATPTKVDKILHSVAAALSAQLREEALYMIEQNE